MSSPAPDTSPPTNATPLLPPPSTPEATSPTLSTPTNLAPPPPATSLIQSPPPPPPPPPGNGLPTGTMVGMIVGIGIGGMSMLVAVGVFFIFYRRYKMKKKMREQVGLEYYSGGGAPQDPKSEPFTLNF
ncbi:Concanavalin A-like lectin/glucanase domain containing protein [Trema orientale]|uniref:Concanavalin A-like lectin/glucanase domain containing protein n=1 Tax=Trema orientale TaxID=63057 RepID=A0A2P5ESC5_TREOI|nr:Concanavalin A-like lectin/glucanase domain containing protein [Trema orientale]